jgi:hypothetical protein
MVCRAKKMCYDAVRLKFSKSTLICLTISEIGINQSKLNGKTTKLNGRG